jgi:hypothetical protein
MLSMKTTHLAASRKLSFLCALLILLDAPLCLIAEPNAAAMAAFNTYSKSVEARLIQQHRSQNEFLVYSDSNPQNERARLRQGDLIIEQLTPASDGALNGALLHHWRGTAFASGATPADFERLMRDFNSYPQHFSPQVLQAKTLSRNGNHVNAWIRIRQHHVITVVMDTTYDVTFGEFDAKHGYSISRSTHIDEIDSPGSSAEHALGPKQEHGFLWRLNTYWSYEERDGGLYIQIESISLTRSVPYGLGWVVRPYVESIPRESLAFTLQSACNAMRK